MVRRRLEHKPAGGGGLSLTAKGILVVSIPVFALLLATALFYIFQKQTSDAQSWVEHTLQVRADIRDAMLELARAETGLRGYLLSGEDSYLATYRGAREALPVPLASLQRLVADNPAQVVRLQQVQSRLGDIMQDMDRL